MSNRIAVVEPGTTLSVLGRIFDTDLVVVRGGDQLLGVYDEDRPLRPPSS
ncbi:MAG: hypothetical protein U0470_08810 [Anaerolineae bacterium]